MNNAKRIAEAHLLVDATKLVQTLLDQSLDTLSSPVFTKEMHKGVQKQCARYPYMGCNLTLREMGEVIRKLESGEDATAPMVNLMPDLDAPDYARPTAWYSVTEWFLEAAEKAEAGVVLCNDFGRWWGTTAPVVDGRVWDNPEFLRAACTLMEVETVEELQGLAEAVDEDGTLLFTLGIGPEQLTPLLPGINENQMQALLTYLEPRFGLYLETVCRKYANQAAQEFASAVKEVDPFTEIRFRPSKDMAVRIS